MQLSKTCPFFISWKETQFRGASSAREPAPVCRGPCGVSSALRLTDVSVLEGGYLHWCRTMDPVCPCSRGLGHLLKCAHLRFSCTCDRSRIWMARVCTSAAPQGALRDIPQQDTIRWMTWKQKREGAPPPFSNMACAGLRPAWVHPIRPCLPAQSYLWIAYEPTCAPRESSSVVASSTLHSLQPASPSSKGALPRCLVPALV